MDKVVDVIDVYYNLLKKVGVVEFSLIELFLCIRHCAKCFHFSHMIFFNCHKNPTTQVLLLDSGIEIWRDLATCPNLHS